jgi:hypothetical protein
LKTSDTPPQAFALWFSQDVLFADLVDRLLQKTLSALSDSSEEDSAGKTSLLRLALGDDCIAAAYRDCKPTASPGSAVPSTTIGAAALYQSYIEELCEAEDCAEILLLVVWAIYAIYVEIWADVVYPPAVPFSKAFEVLGPEAFR